MQETQAKVENKGIFVAYEDLLELYKQRFIDLFFEEIYNSTSNSKTFWGSFNRYNKPSYERVWWGVYNSSVDGLSYGSDGFNIVSVPAFTNFFKKEYLVASDRFDRETVNTNSKEDNMKEETHEYIKPSERKKSKPRQKPPVRTKTDAVITYTNGKEYTLKNILNLSCYHTLGEQPDLSFEHKTEVVAKNSIFVRKFTFIQVKDVADVLIKTPEGVVVIYTEEDNFKLIDERINSYAVTNNFGLEF